MAAGFSLEQARLAGVFSQYSILGLLPSVLYQLLATFWQVQQNVRPALVVSFIFLLANAGLNIVLVFGVGSFVGWGFVGSPIATSLTRTGMLLLLWLYTVPFRRLHKKCWAGFTAAAFEGSIVRAVILRQALPALLAGALESWQLQCVAFLAARMGAVALASHMAMMNFYYFSTSIRWVLCGNGCARGVSPWRQSRARGQARGTSRAGVLRDSGRGSWGFDPRRARILGPTV